MSNPFLGQMGGLTALAEQYEPGPAMLKELRAIRALLEQLVKDKEGKIDSATP